MTDQQEIDLAVQAERERVLGYLEGLAIVFERTNKTDASKGVQTALVQLREAFGSESWERITPETRVAAATEGNCNPATPRTDTLRGRNPPGD